VTLDLIKKTTVFWDFDGVIKESVEVKSDAFEQLFIPFGKDIAKKIRKHHEENGGISRFDKLPIYLDWAEQPLSEQLITKYSENFSQLVKQRVVDSPWVAGVLNYLQNNHKKQQFFLITATPQREIDDILSQLDILKYFKQVIGSPTSKTKAIKILLKRYNIDFQRAIMIGDSGSDYDAAMENHLAFILRKTKLNTKLQRQINCLKIKNFMEV